MVSYNKKKSKGSRLHSVDQRGRLVDINSLSPEQIVCLSDTIGKTVNSILSDAQKRVQDILDVYGMQLKLQYSLTPKDDKINIETDETPANTEES